MRRATSARDGGVSGASDSRSTTMMAFCTRMPTPIPSPASVSRLAGMPNRYSVRAVAATATAVVPITAHTPRRGRSISSNTTVTANIAIPPRRARSCSSSASAMLSSLATVSFIPGGSCAPSVVISRRSVAAVAMASAPGWRVTSSATAGRPLMRKNWPRASSSARTTANSPSMNRRPPGATTGSEASESSAAGSSRSTTAFTCVPRVRVPNDATTRAEAMASLKRSGAMPSWRSRAAS